MSVAEEGSNRHWEGTSRVGLVRPVPSPQDARSTNREGWDASFGETVPGLRVGGYRGT